MMSEMKRKQKKKSGRVVRLNPSLDRLVRREQREDEAIHETIQRLIEDGDVRYVLPSDLHESVEDARGVAVVRAVKAKVKRTEKPIPVRVKE